MCKKLAECTAVEQDESISVYLAHPDSWFAAFEIFQIQAILVPMDNNRWSRTVWSIQEHYTAFACDKSQFFP